MAGEETRKVIQAHAERYPAMECADYVKLLYQNEMGCGHLVQDETLALHFLTGEQEKPRREAECGALAEDIGNGLCRVHLGAKELEPGLLPLLARLFAATAGTHNGTLVNLQKKLGLLREMVRCGEIPLDIIELESFCKSYESAGLPSLHHSEAFRSAYAPRYRVVEREYMRYFSQLVAVWRCAAMEKGPVITAVDGRCGSGKTTLAAVFGEALGCPVFHMDDFFLFPELRTPERLAQPGGNIHWERFRSEVLTPLRAGEPVCYHPYSCQKGELMGEVHVAPPRLAIVEGSYALHPALARCYNIRLFVTCSPEIQRERLLKRSGKTMLRRFEEEWIPMEEAYFRAFSVEGQCDGVVDTSDSV